MSTDVNLLSDMVIDEVSLVDRGANQHAQVVLSKRKDDDMNPDVGDMHVPGNDKKKKKDEDKGFFKGLVEKFFPSDPIEKFGRPPQQMGPPMMDPMQQQMPMQPQMPPVQPGMPQGVPQQGGEMQIPPEVIEYIQYLEQELSGSQPQQGNDNPSNPPEEENMSNKPFGKSADDDLSLLEELAKSVADEESREAISKALEAVSKAEERAAQAEEIAKAERDHRVTQEYITKARGYAHLPVDPEEFGPVLKRMNENLSEEDFEAVTKVLAAGSDTFGKLFGEIGSFTAPVMTGQLESVAKSIREADSTMTKEQAIAKALEENPDLYEEYLNGGNN